MSPGPARGRDGADLGDRHPGARQRLCVDRRPVGELLARGELGYDAAIGPVHRELARDDRSEHPPQAVDHRTGGVVAAGFDAEDERRAHAASLPAPGIRGGGGTPRGACGPGHSGPDAVLLASAFLPDPEPPPATFERPTGICASRSPAGLLVLAATPVTLVAAGPPDCGCGLPRACRRRARPHQGPAGTSRSRARPAVRGRYSAGVYPCSNVDLLEFMSPLVRHRQRRVRKTNDIWGWTDPLTERP